MFSILIICGLFIIIIITIEYKLKRRNSLRIIADNQGEFAYALCRSFFSNTSGTHSGADKKFGNIIEYSVMVTLDDGVNCLPTFDKICDN